MDRTQALRIVQGMISKHFQEIEGTAIKIYFVTRKDYYMSVGLNLPGYRLFINKAALDFSESAFKGCLAHELEHIADLKQKGLIGRLRDVFFPGSNIEEERNIDFLVVNNRNLGKELLQFHNEHNKKFKSYKSNEGLTKWEIKKILKNFPAKKDNVDHSQ